MGTLTRGTIVSEGMLLAGRDDLTARANVWLQLWLNAVAASWPWTQLKRVYVSGVSPDSQVGTIGGAVITYGNAGAGGDYTVLRVLDNCWLYDENQTFRKRIRILPQESEPFFVTQAAANRRGVPEQAQLVQTDGTWALFFDPAPDREYFMSNTVIQQGAQLAADADIPWYPNDNTMVNYIAAKTQEYDDGSDSPAFRAAIEAVTNAVRDDRMRYGSDIGNNDRMILDAAVFR